MRGILCGVCIALPCLAAACGLDDGGLIALEATEPDASGFDAALFDGSIGDSAIAPSDSAATDSETGRDAAASTDSGPIVELIYGGTSSDLYAINPAARTATHLGAFAGCGNPVFVNDIAVDPSGTIYGLVRSDTTTTGAGLYTIAQDGTCTLKHALVDDSNHPQGIAFTAAGTLLAARDDTRDLVSIDVGTGHEAVVRGNAFPDTPTNDLVCNATLCWATFSNNNCGTAATNGCYFSLNTNGTNTTQLGGASPADAVGIAYANGKMYAFDTAGPIWEITIATPPVATQIAVTGAPVTGWSGGGSAPTFP